jgi:hypothetical protein
MRSAVRSANLILVGTFLLAISLPIVDAILGIDHSPPLLEKRTLAPRPDLPDGWPALEAFPAAFESHWNDAFGFRRTLIRRHNRILVALGTSPLPDRVTVGSDGWLFYTAEGALEDFKGERPFREGELVRWQYLLEARRDWLKDRGIPYLLVVAPNKETVYGDHMSRRVPRGASHRLDRWLDFLTSHSDVDILDPRALLSAARPQGDVYRRTDSHWSALGAWLVTEAIARRMAETFPGVRPLQPEDLETSTGPGAGDLAGLLGLNTLLSEYVTQLLLARPRAQPSGTTTNISSWTTVDDASLPRGVFFHDSFGEVQRPYLAEHFSRLQCAQIPEMDPEIVEAEQPQLVVQEMAERFLATTPPDDSMVLTDNSRVRAAFDASRSTLVRLPGDTVMLEPIPPLQVEPASDGTVVLQATQTPSLVLLPEVQRPAGSFPVVRIGIESPADARLLVSYRIASAPTEWQGHWWPLHAGANLAWFVLPDPELAGRLRLELTTPGTYRLTSLEIRAVTALPR